MNNTSLKPKKGFFHYVERGGNALPDPAILFALFCLSILLLSLLGSLLNWGGIHPATGEAISVKSLASRDGLHWIILETVRNFTSFAPLGIVMVALLGMGIAETSGLIKSAINAMLAKAPPKMVTLLIVFAGLLSNVASDLGYILIIPLAGVIFHSLGRNPLVGMAAAFAGVSGGFSANILISTQDPLLAGLSTAAAQILDPYYEVSVMANYYFMAVSTFMIAAVVTVVTVKWVEPRLGPYTGDLPREEMEKPTALEKKGLKRAGWVCLGWIALLVLGLAPENGILRGADGSLLGTPVLRGFITILFLIAVSAGAAYGFTVGTYKQAKDIITGMNESMKTLASYLVLVFFCAQFVAWFDWSNLGLLLAINGANFLQEVNLHWIPLFVLFILLTGFINLFMGSASAKWAIMGPIFIPIFMLLGYSPELSQAVFRVGDSITNIITPMMVYFALVIVYFQKYDKKSGIGTIIATMLPYSIALFISWTLLLILWIWLGIPLGPGVDLFYTLPVAQ
ncbi:MAG: AbgT family transporter [Bacteroidales bacterium]|nr:AbgT family transporter [Bacteroidales bacterium]